VGGEEKNKKKQIIYKKVIPLSTLKKRKGIKGKITVNNIHNITITMQSLQLH